MMALTRAGRRVALAAPATALAATLMAGGCTPDFSPNTYNAAAVQQANKVEQGVVVGVRDVDVKVSGNTGAAAGAAAGGITGSQLPGGGATQALGAVGGGLLGGLLGSGVERATGDTKAYEYIVRKPNNELVSVTQTDKVPLALGQRVLVIAGSQARIVPDYTTQLPEPPKPEAPRATIVQETLPPKLSVDPSVSEPAKPEGPPATPAPAASPNVNSAPRVTPPTPLAPPAAANLTPIMPN
jgi:outer membrane lipoprotein SlyB